MQIAAADRLPALRAQILLYVMEGALLMLGILSAVFLFRNRKERDADTQEDGVLCERPLRYRLRLFFSIPMLLFVLWCIANMLTLILMAIFS